MDVRGAAGEGQRLRLSRLPRQHAGGQVADQGLLRQRADVLVLRRLLAGGTSRPDGGSALSGGLRRDHRRRSGARLDAPDDRRAVDRCRVTPQERGDRPAAGEAGPHHADSAQYVRRSRQRPAGLSRRAATLRLRSVAAAVPRRWPVQLPDAGAGPGREADLPGPREPAHGRPDLSRLRARQRDRMAPGARRTPQRGRAHPGRQLVPVLHQRHLQ